MIYPTSVLSFLRDLSSFWYKNCYLDDDLLRLLYTGNSISRNSAHMDAIKDGVYLVCFRVLNQKDKKIIIYNYIIPHAPNCLYLNL